MRAGAIAVGYDGAIDVGAVVVVDAAHPGAGHGVSLASGEEVRARRAGVIAEAAGRVAARVGDRGCATGELRVRSEKPGVDRTDQDALAGDATGIGLIGVHRRLAVIGEVLGRAPARGISDPAGILIAGRLTQGCVRNTGTQKEAQSSSTQWPQTRGVRHKYLQITLRICCCR